MAESPSDEQFPALISYPSDGYGGSLYTLRFVVPVYDTEGYEVRDSVSWSEIDAFYQINAVNLTIPCAALTISVITILNIITITPSHRRKLPIYKLMMLALFCHALAELCATIAFIHSPAVSAYIQLTMDVQSISFTSSYKGILWVFSIATAASFAFLQTCLYIQGTKLLIWLHIHHPYHCAFIKLSLVFTGFSAFCLNVTIVIMDALNYSYGVDYDQFIKLAVWDAQFISYNISIIGWSVVFFASAVTILHQRRKSLLNRNTFYESVLNLITVIGLHSFIIPILLCCLQFLMLAFLQKLRYINPGRLTTSVVLFLLSLTSLFASTHDDDPVSDTTNDAERDRSPLHDLPQQENGNYILLPHTTCERPNLNPTIRTAIPSSRVPDALDLELEAIDAMGVESQQRDCTSVQTKGESAKNENNGNIGHV